MPATGLPAPDRSQPRRILIAGGHQHIRGGLEIFIARDSACLGIGGHCFTETPGAGPGSLGCYIRALRAFRRALSSYDIVWLQYGSVFDLAYLALAKLSGKKVVVTPHLGGGWRSMRRGAVRTVCNRLLTLADAVFTLHQTQPLSLGFPARLGRRCRVMGTFLPRELLEGDTPSRRPARPVKLVHVARLSAAKGSFAFLEVCEALRRRGVAFEATMVGPGDDAVRRALTAEIERRSLAVTRLGALPPPELMALLRRQDVLVNLSLQDAYPLTVMEALLCGVAPVASSLPGTRELAVDAPAIALVAGQDAEAAADRILAIDWASVANSAEVLRRKFGWAVLARRYAGAFAGLAANPPRIACDKPIKAIAP
jgi:glycosyltransferase involved in cell wall biosynthesis